MYVGPWQELALSRALSRMQNQMPSGQALQVPETIPPEMAAFYEQWQQLVKQYGESEAQKYFPHVFLARLTEPTG